MTLATKLRRSSIRRNDSDPYWNDVILLLTAQGEEQGSTSFIDKSNYNIPIQASLYTNPIYNTKTQSLEPNIGSIYFSPTPAITEGSFLQAPANHSDIILPTITEWTYECYVRPFPNFSTNVNCGILFYGTRGSNNYRIELELRNASNGFHSITGYIQASTSSGGYLNPPEDITIPTEQWAHLAITRNGTKYRVFVNGIGGTEREYVQNWHNNTASLMIGVNREAGLNCSFKDYIDQVRVTKVVRYVEDFTPDFKAFPIK